MARDVVTDLDDATTTVKFPRDCGSNFTAAFDSVPADAGILCTVLRHVRTPCVNVIIHHNTHQTHTGLAAAAPLRPLPPNVTDLIAFRGQ